MRPPGELRHPQRLLPTAGHTPPPGVTAAHTPLGPDRPPVSLPEATVMSPWRLPSPTPSQSALAGRSFRWTVLGPAQPPGAPAHSRRPAPRQLHPPAWGGAGRPPNLGPLSSRAVFTPAPPPSVPYPEAVSVAQGSVEKCLDVQMKSFRKKGVRSSQRNKHPFKRIKIIKILLELYS